MNISLIVFLYIYINIFKYDIGLSAFGLEMALFDRNN